MARCKFCGQEIEFITITEGPKAGRQIPVEPEPRLIKPDKGPDAATYYTPEGEFLRGIPGTKEDEAAYQPHRCVQWE